MAPIANRLASALLALWLAATLAFFALRIIPGDAIAAQLAQSGASTAFIEEQRHTLGLDSPLTVQYLDFLKSLLQGDLGLSLLEGLPVAELIWNYFIPTLQLASGALLVATTLGLVLGILAAIDVGYGVSFAARTLVNLALSTPIYWTGMLAIYFSTLLIEGFSYSGGRPDQLPLPVAVLGFHTSGAVARVLQANIRAAYTQDYVRTARAKGLKERRIIGLHVLKPALLPTLSVIALQAGFLLGGTVITESLFVRPGIGQLLLTRTIQQDYPVVQGIVILSAAVYTLLNALADIIHQFLDPRTTIS